MVVATISGHHRGVAFLLLILRRGSDDGEGSGADVRGALLEMIERDAGGEHVVVEADEMRQFRVQNHAFAALFPLNAQILAFAKERLSRLPFLRPFCS